MIRILFSVGVWVLFCIFVSVWLRGRVRGDDLWKLEFLFVFLWVVDWEVVLYGESYSDGDVLIICVVCFVVYCCGGECCDSFIFVGGL